MCGILGIIESDRFLVTRADMESGLTAIRHRGPDDHDIWNENGVWLGHRRLSIVDLSPAGRQPMISHDGRYALNYNGEIYNYQALRSELEARGVRQWRGASDTEVLLELIAADGFEAAVKKANGMFAIAVWDRHEKRLFLARDRFGEKPLFYGLRRGGFAFASELTALEAIKGFDVSISSETVARYFARGYFQAPDSIYADVHKLPPASLLTWKPGETPRITQYWSIDTIIAANANMRERPCDQVEAVERLDALIRKATAMRMEADVPVGVFLSGGIDSSLVAAAMQQCASRPITTFTLGFEDEAFNEAHHAREVARHLGTAHVEETVTTGDALDVVQRLGAMYDEPLADDSQIPTYLVSKMARRHVTVALSGDGGDELFGGYRRHVGTPALWRRIRRMPLPHVAQAAFTTIPTSVMDKGLGFLREFSDRYGKAAGVGQTLRRVAPWLTARSLLQLHEYSLEKWPHFASPVLGAPGIVNAWGDAAAPVKGELDQLCWHDMHNYLPGDILAKVDRASMAVSLESRIPLLDPDVAAFAWSLPVEMRVRERKGKWILREVLKRYVPPALFERPKTGFAPPLESWLLGPLRGWAEDMLSAERLTRQGILDVSRVRTFWTQYQRGGTLEDAKAWSVLMFQAWLDGRAVNALAARCLRGRGAT
jgi:asparagine synthase (glutamine-hydrolysing)